MSQVELLDVERSIVVVIDLQGKLMDMVWRSRLVRDASIRLMRLAGIFRVPVLLTEQYPEGLGPTHPEVRATFDAREAESSQLEGNFSVLMGELSVCPSTLI